MGSREYFRVLLGVRECGDTPLVYGCEVDKEHMHAACPAVCLLGGAVYMSIWFFFAQ